MIFLAIIESYSPNTLLRMKNLLGNKRVKVTFLAITLVSTGYVWLCDIDLHYKLSFVVVLFDALIIAVAIVQCIKICIK